MGLRRRILRRVHRMLVYWGFVKHPFGSEFVREHYSPTGRSSVGDRGGE